VQVRRRHASVLVLALCGLFSGLLNLGLLAAILLLIDPVELPEIERVTYLDLTPDREPLEREPPREEPPEKEPLTPEEKRKQKLEEEKRPEIELDELPAPEEEEDKKEEEEEEQTPEEEKPPVDFVMENLKMVEQPDELDEEEVPDDVNYLSNVNRDVREETRAEVTNLERDAVDPKAQQVEPSNEPDPGTADEQVIAQVEEHESQLNRQAPETTPQPEEQRPEQDDPKPKSLLAMRDLEHRDHRMAQEEREALANEADDGALNPEQDHQASIEAREQQARIDKNDKAYKFRLTQKDHDALFGKDHDAKKSYEAKKQSKTKGVWEDARAHWQSPLENMVPEVQPGNQTALRSRKHPFARYIATIHRTIHDQWAWGYLEQLDTRSRNHELNDYKLWTRVEIVLNGDGTIDKVTTVRHSGKLVFDAAAREIVYASAPFPNPPREIMSGNGKVYIHWAFHRDERACGTFGAQPFILDNVGGGDRPDPNVPVRAGRGGENLSRRLGGAQRPRAAAVAEGPAPPSGARGHHDHDHDHDHDHAHGEASKPKAAASAEEMAADPKARKAANEWLHYFGKGDIDRAVARSSVPFYQGDTIIARSREELGGILRAISDEAKGGGAPKAVKVYTAAELRKVFGSVPSGVQEGNARVYGLTKVGGEYVVLLLEKKFGTWRVIGLSR
jgi:TonB family protein